MAVCFLTRTPAAKGVPTYYRIEITLNLFGEWSVVFDWGQRGTRGRQRIALFNDLRAASRIADQVRERMLRRGYNRA